MREPIELRAALFPVTQHQIAGQVAVLKEARARITAGCTIEQARTEIGKMISELEARLTVNAAASSAVLPEFLGEFGRAAAGASA